MGSNGSPSIAALVLPLSPDAARALLSTILPAEGYAPAVEAPPKPQRSFPEEWLELVILPGSTSADGHATSLIATAEAGRVFHLALRLSKQRPDLVFVAWRRYQGCEPVAKVFADGRPQWRDGEDPDHEVFFHVPAERPAELRLPQPLTLPAGARALEAQIAPALTAVASGQTRGQTSVWVHRRSPFARRA